MTFMSKINTGELLTRHEGLSVYWAKLIMLHSCSGDWATFFFRGWRCIVTAVISILGVPSPLNTQFPVFSCQAQWVDTAAFQTILSLFSFTPSVCCCVYEYWIRTVNAHMRHLLEKNNLFCFLSLFIKLTNVAFIRIMNYIMNRDRRSSCEPLCNTGRVTLVAGNLVNPSTIHTSTCTYYIDTR